MGARIRRARPDEANALSELAVRAKSHWGYPPVWIRLWRADLTLTQEYLSSHAGLVAIEYDRLIGCCVVELREREQGASLEHVWVEPACQGRGVGRTLVTHALDIAVRAGVSRVAVIADPFAEGFYLKLGASRVGAVPAPMPGAPGRLLPLLEFGLAHVAWERGRPDPSFRLKS